MAQSKSEIEQKNLRFVRRPKPCAFENLSYTVKNNRFSTVCSYFLKIFVFTSECTVEVYYMQALMLGRAELTFAFTDESVRICTGGLSPDHSISRVVHARTHIINCNSNNNNLLTDPFLIFININIDKVYIRMQIRSWHGYDSVMPEFRITLRMVYTQVWTRVVEGCSIQPTTCPRIVIVILDTLQSNPQLVGSHGTDEWKRTTVWYIHGLMRPCCWTGQKLTGHKKSRDHWISTPSTRLVRGDSLFMVCQCPEIRNDIFVRNRIAFKYIYFHI